MSFGILIGSLAPRLRNLEPAAITLFMYLAYGRPDNDVLEVISVFPKLIQDKLTL
jgi:hypothetical protein